MDRQDLLCFVCDKMIPGAQLQNHVNKCKVIFETQNKVRLIMPDEYSILFKAFKENMMLDKEELENFNRMLEEKSLKNGESIATPQQAKEMDKEFTETIKKSSQPVQRSKGERPRLMVCVLCGREFGSTSLPIHMKTCRVKFDQEQENLPKHMRKNADKLIENYNKNMTMLQAGGNYSVDQVNNDAFDQYNKEALAKCENCGRTFLPDRLIVHQRSCLKHPKK